MYKIYRFESNMSSKPNKHTNKKKLKIKNPNQTEEGSNGSDKARRFARERNGEHVRFVSLSPHPLVSSPNGSFRTSPPPSLVKQTAPPPPSLLTSALTHQSPSPLSLFSSLYFPPSLSGIKQFCER
jgi:hypothetical protein